MMCYLHHGSRLLLGLLFVATGVNGWLFLLDLPTLAPFPRGNDFIELFIRTYWLVVPVKAIEVLAGWALLTNRFTALALAALAPIAFNFTAYHLFEEPQSIGPALLAVVLLLFQIFQHRAVFGPLFRYRSAIR